MGRLFTKSTLLTVAAMALSLTLPSQDAAAQEGGTYRYSFKPYGNKDWVGMRYRVSDGETWRASGGNWVKVTEKGATPEEGTYKIHIVAAKDLHSWWAFRCNVDTGRTWRLSAGTWIDMPTVTDNPQ